MSRSGYSDDYDYDDAGRANLWRGSVERALKGKRGQAMLREMAATLDAMPEKVLAPEALKTADGEFCALGVVGQARGLDMSKVDPEDWDAVAKMFGIAPSMVREVVFENDESVDAEKVVDFTICGPVRPGYPDWGSHTRTKWVTVGDAEERRWKHMRAWVASQIIEEPSHGD